MEAKKNNSKLWMFFSAAFISGIAGSIFLPEKFLLGFYTDDGFFYLKVARNFSSGLGSTFDSINYTNGYHPLWMIFLSVFYFIPSFISNNLGHEIYFRIGTALQHCLGVLTLLIMYRVFFLLFKDGALKRFFLFTVVVLPAITLKNFGMEIHITVMLLSFYIFLKAREICINRRNDILKSFVMMFLAFTRTEFLFTLIPVLIVYESYDKQVKCFFKNLVRFSLPTAAAALVYFSLNYIYFGHLESISNAVKSTFPKVHIIEFFLRLYESRYGRIYTIVPLIYFISSVTLLIFRIYLEKKKGEVSRFDLFLFWISFGLGSYLFLNALFNIEGINEWYLTGTTLVSTVIITTMLKRTGFLTSALTVVLLLFYIFSFYTLRFSHNRYSDMYDYAHDLQRVVPEDKTIFQVDFCGIVGFFSDRKVVNGDGLMNDFEYYKHLKAMHIQDYLIEKDIDYYSSYTTFVDSAAGLVVDEDPYLWRKLRVEFPARNIVFRKPQNFKTAFTYTEYEWILVGIKHDTTDNGPVKSANSRKLIHPEF